MKPTILLGITGGIAVVKIPELIDSLQTQGYTIEVIMTSSATQMISVPEIESRIGRKVHTQLFENTIDTKQILKERKVEHIALADRIDLFVIVPASANTIAKLAHGLSDDYLTTTALAVSCPIFVCPSMNVHMWTNPATQQNIATLHKLGYHLLGPDAGMLACGYKGEGRLIDIKTLTKTIASSLSLTKPLHGKKVLVTAGGTIEPIDDVRVITNKSSGKMGIALAEAAFLAGADVLLLRSTTAVSSRMGIQEHTFDTAESLEILMKTHCPDMDICIHTAAVSDFQVKNKKPGKTSSDRPLALELEPRKKILESIKQYNPNIFLVAFKAESHVTQKELVSLARQRLKKANADLIIANDIGKKGIGFQSDENEVIVIKPNGAVTHIPKARKSRIAEEIIRHI
jgi:phosphopantothenoylcysteine decarboxylase/phosphopantothenate--cysteine ligase